MSLKIDIKKNAAVFLDLTGGRKPQDTDFSSHLDQIATGNNFINVLEGQGEYVNIAGQTTSFYDLISIDLKYDDKVLDENGNPSNLNISYKPFYSPDAGDFGNIMQAVNDCADLYINVILDFAIYGAIQPKTITDFIKEQCAPLYQDFGSEIELATSIMCASLANPGDPSAILQDPNVLINSLEIAAPNLMADPTFNAWSKAIITSMTSAPGANQDPNDFGNPGPLINQAISDLAGAAGGWISKAIGFLDEINELLSKINLSENADLLSQDWSQNGNCTQEQFAQMVDATANYFKEHPLSVSDLQELTQMHTEYATAVNSNIHDTPLDPSVLKNWIQGQINKVPSVSIDYDQSNNPIIDYDGIGTWNILTKANDFIFNFFEGPAGKQLMDNILSKAVDWATDKASEVYTEAVQNLVAGISGVDKAIVQAVTGVTIYDNLGNSITGNGVYDITGHLVTNSVNTHNMFGAELDTIYFENDGRLIFDYVKFIRDFKEINENSNVHLGGTFKVVVNYASALYDIDFNPFDGNDNLKTEDFQTGTQEFVIKLSELTIPTNTSIVIEAENDYVGGAPESLGDGDLIHLYSTENTNVDTGSFISEAANWNSANNNVQKAGDKVIVDLMAGFNDPDMPLIGGGFLYDLGSHDGFGGGSQSGPGVLTLTGGFIVPGFNAANIHDFYFLEVDSITINGEIFDATLLAGYTDNPNYQAMYARVKAVLDVIHFGHYQANENGISSQGKLVIDWDNLDDLMKKLDIAPNSNGSYDFKVNYLVREYYENAGETFLDLYDNEHGLVGGNNGTFTSKGLYEFKYINPNYTNGDTTDFSESIEINEFGDDIVNFDNSPFDGNQWGNQAYVAMSNGQLDVDVAANSNSTTGAINEINFRKFFDIWDEQGTVTQGGPNDGEIDHYALTKYGYPPVFTVKIGNNEYVINQNISPIYGGADYEMPSPQGQDAQYYTINVANHASNYSAALIKAVGTSVAIDRDGIIQYLKDHYAVTISEGDVAKIEIDYRVGNILGPDSTLSVAINGDGTAEILTSNSEKVVSLLDGTLKYDGDLNQGGFQEQEFNTGYWADHFNPAVKDQSNVVVDVRINDQNAYLGSVVEFTNGTNLASDLVIEFSDGRPSISLGQDSGYYAYIENNKIVIVESDLMQFLSSLNINLDNGLSAKIKFDYTVKNADGQAAGATLEFLMQADGSPFEINDEELTMKEKDGLTPTSSPVLAHNVGLDTTRIHIYKNDTKGYEFQNFQFEDDASSDAGYQVVAHVHKVFSNGAQDFDIIIDADIANALKASHLGNDLSKYYVDINRKSIIDQILAKNPQLGAWKINDGDTVTLEIKYGVTYKDAFGTELTNDAVLKINILGQSDILPLKANNEHVFITEETYDINADVYNDPNFQEQIAWYEGDNLVVDVMANDSTQGSYDTVNIAGSVIQGQVFRVDINGNVTPATSMQLDYNDLESQGIIFINSNGRVELDKMALIEYLGVAPFFDGDKIELNINYYLTSSDLIDVFPTPKSNIATLKVTLDGDGTFTAVTDADETISLNETNNNIGQFSNIAEYINNETVKIDLSKNTVYHNAVLEDYQITYITAKLTKAGQVVDINLPQSIFHQIISGNKFYLQANKTEIIAKILEEIQNNPAFANLSGYDKDFNTSDTLKIKVGYKLSTNSLTDNYSPTDESTLTINLSGKDKLIVDESEEIIVNENDTSIISSTVVEADGSLINPGVDVSYLQNSIQNAIKIEVADNATLSGASISGLVVTNCVASISQANGSANGFFVLDDSFYDVHTGINGTYITINKQKVLSLAAGGQFNFHAGDKIEITVNYDLTAQTASSGGLSGLTETMVDHSQAKIIINGEGGPISITGEENVIISETPTGYGNFAPFEYIWEIVNGSLANFPSHFRVLSDPLDDSLVDISSLIKFEVFDGNKLKLSAVDPDRLAQILDKGASARYGFKLSYGGVEKDIQVTFRGTADSILSVDVQPQATLNNGDSITINLKDYVNDFEIDPTKSNHDDTTLDNFIAITLIDPITNSSIGDLQGIFDYMTGEVTIDASANGINGAILQGLAMGDYKIHLSFRANSSYQGDFDNDKLSSAFADIKFVVGSGNGGNDPTVDTAANTFAVEENDGAADSSSGVVGSSDFKFNLSATDDVTPANQLTYGKVGNTVTVSGILPSGTSAANFALMLDSLLTVNHNGEVIFNTSSANGPSKFDYLKPGDSATITFNFTVTDGDGNTTTSTSTITINGTNDGPVAYNFVGPQFTEDQLISFDLTVTDIDQGDTHTFEKVPGYIDINGSGNGLLNQTDVLNAITVNPDGTVTVDNSVFQALGATHNVTIIFKYKVTDLAGAMSEEKSVTFSVTGLDDMSGNDEPTANSLDVTHQEGAIPAGFQLVATDPDGDALTYSFSNFDVSVASGTILPATLANIEAAILAHLNTAGNFNTSTGQFTLPNSVFDQLNLGQNVLVNFNYSVNDGKGGVGHSTANITIEGKDGNGNGGDGIGPTVDTAVNTFAVEENDGATDSSSGVVGSSNFRFNLSATDNITQTNQLVYAKSSSVSVSGTQPSGMSAADFASTLNSLLTVNANGQVIFNTSSANGSSKFDYLKPGDSAAVTFNFTVTDGDGNTTTSTSTITINGTNDAPVASDVVIQQQFTEDQFINFDLTVSDVDQGDTHVFTKIPGFIQITGSGSTLLNQTDVLNAITVNPDGTVTVNNAVFQDLTLNKNVTVTFQYKASDASGAETGIKTATFNVSGLNDFIGNTPPTANIFEATYQENNIPSSIQLVANDPDGDTLVYYFEDIDVTIASGTISQSVLSDIKMAVIVHLNAMGNFNINNGQFSLPNSIFSQLNLGQNVLVKFNYEVNDGKGGVAHNTAKITINGLDGNGGGGGSNIAPTLTDETDANITYTEISGNTSTLDATDVVATFTIDDPDAPANASYVYAEGDFDIKLQIKIGATYVDVQGQAANWFTITKSGSEYLVKLTNTAINALTNLSAPGDTNDFQFLIKAKDQAVGNTTLYSNQITTKVWHLNDDGVSLDVFDGDATDNSKESDVVVNYEIGRFHVSDDSTLDQDNFEITLSDGTTIVLDDSSAFNVIKVSGTNDDAIYKITLTSNGFQTLKNHYTATDLPGTSTNYTITVKGINDTNTEEDIDTITWSLEDDSTPNDWITVIRLDNINLEELLSNDANFIGSMDVFFWADITRETDIDGNGTNHKAMIEGYSTFTVTGGTVGVDECTLSHFQFGTSFNEDETASLGAGKGFFLELQALMAANPGHDYVDLTKTLHVYEQGDPNNSYDKTITVRIWEDDISEIEHQV